MCITEKCFPSSSSLLQHCTKDRGLKARKTSNSVADLNKIKKNEEEREQLRIELNARHLFLTDNEIGNGRRKLLIFSFFAIGPNIGNEKVDHVFGKIDCEAEENPLRNLESSVCHEYLLKKQQISRNH